MRHLFGYLRPHWRTVCIILVLLVAQAYGELALPAYTSKIVDVGLQSSGIEHAAPEQVSEQSMQELKLLMTEEERSAVESSYTLSDSDGIYYRNGDIRGETLEQLDASMELPEALLYQMAQSGKADPEQLLTAYQTGKLDEETILQMREQAVAAMGDMSDTMLHQVAVQYVQQEYTALGLNLNRIQNQYLWKSGAKMLLMTLVIVLAAVLIGLLAARTAAAVSRDLRGAVFRQVVSYSSKEVNQFSTASLITRSTNDIQQIQMVTVMMLRMVLFAPVMGIGSIIKVISTHTGLGWIIVVAVAATMGVVFGLMGMAMPKFKKMQTLVDNVNRVSREILTGIMPIRAFSREKHEEERFDVANTELKRTQLFTNRVMTFMMPTMMLIMYCVMGAIVWFGARNIDNGIMQVGDMTAFLSYTMQVIMSFMMISIISIMLPRAGVAADRIYEVITTEPSIHDAEDAVVLDQETARGVVEFHDVSFRFPGGEHNALEHISFKAEPGKTTAIIGSTGCGKSTLLNLIPRFYDVTEGAVTVDGVDIRTMTQSSLRSLLGYVPQKGILFSGDIESNLKFGGDTITDEEMVRAAQIAQAAEFIDEKVDRYHSVIAQGGSNVSGGQKQRLSIARAIAKKPKIFLFDDSFSALDYKTDTLLRRELKENVGDATVLIVAQRISTILHADQIIVLNEGRIDGIGTHEQLLQSCATYQEIAHSQLSAKELGMEGGQA
ncbi:MAG: ABC transporter ATP-binding protein [Eubacteriales bacterium]|nr:ABC transporter ATP-binding protein [Eubacteriales bacterium]